MPKQHFHATKKDKDNLYDKLEEELELLLKWDTIILLGDFTAQISKEGHIKNVTGRYSLHQKTNNNEIRLEEFGTSINMILTSTKFNHPKEHKVTWMSPDQKNL